MELSEPTLRPPCELDFYKLDSGHVPASRLLDTSLSSSCASGGLSALCGCTQ